MKIRVIDPIIDSRWNEFVASQAHSTFFHTAAWAQTIKEAYGYSPRYFVLENEYGQFRAAIPLYIVSSWLTGERLVGLPFSDSCWPLGNHAADIISLFTSVKKDIEAGTASYLEIRGWQNGVTPTQLDLIARDYQLSHLLDLQPGINALKERFHQSIRRGIKQAKKRGVTVRMTQAEVDLNHFYKLNLATRKRLGVLPQPHGFFKALFHHVISRDLGFFLMAEWKGKLIAGVLLLTYNDTVYYKFNASDENYLQKRPNHLLIWEAIQYASANNYKYFDFGRCSPENEGLRLFKSRWGAKEINSPYYYYPKVKGFTTVSENSLRYQAMKLFAHIMPEFAFRIAGSLLYKHLA